jgi:hypothetical protein
VCCAKFLFSNFFAAAAAAAAAAGGRQKFNFASICQIL